jgi:hypothetical protein
MGDLSALMTGKTPPVKYGDPGHPTVTVQVGKTIIPRVLVDLGAAHQYHDFGNSTTAAITGQSQRNPDHS